MNYSRNLISIVLLLLVTANTLHAQLRLVDSTIEPVNMFSIVHKKEVSQIYYDASDYEVVAIALITYIY